MADDGQRTCFVPVTIEYFKTVFSDSRFHATSLIVKFIFTNTEFFKFKYQSA